MNNKDYKLEILLTPHQWDNATNPYFWNILKFDVCWYSIANGWASNVLSAYEDALNAFIQITLNNN